MNLTYDTEGINENQSKKEKESKSARFCDPAICDHCIYLGEGDFACIKDESDAVIVIDEWEPTDDFMQCMKGKQK